MFIVKCFAWENCYAQLVSKLEYHCSFLKHDRIAYKLTLLCNFHGDGNGLLMHFCESNHEATRMQQEGKQQHQTADINYMLIRK